MKYYGFEPERLDKILRGMSRRMLAVLEEHRGDYVCCNGVGRMLVYWRKLPFDEPSLSRTVDALDKRGLLVWTAMRPWPRCRTKMTDLGKAVLNRWSRR